MNPTTAAHARDPLLWVSILLAVTGSIQASTGLLSTLAAQHPVAFGLVMTGISVATGILTVIKTNLTLSGAPPKE